AEAEGRMEDHLFDRHQEERGVWGYEGEIVASYRLLVACCRLPVACCRCLDVSSSRLKSFLQNSAARVWWLTTPSGYRLPPLLEKRRGAD
ncbi:hypothetical protein, partial [Salinimicrobium oceani]|uniref:hypothetical protein n=1 Tax=Salinimicrobium oceani TaxID=2722702 RepID=UPI001ADDE36A